MCARWCRFVSPSFRNHANNTSISKQILSAGVSRWRAAGRVASSRLCVPIDDALKQTRLCLVLLCRAQRPNWREIRVAFCKDQPRLREGNIVSLWAVLSLRQEEEDGGWETEWDSSVFSSPLPPKNEPLLEGNPTNVAVGELETGISSAQTHRSSKQSCQKTNGAIQTPYPHLQRHRHRTIDDTIEVRSEIADGHESSPTSFSFFLDRQLSANETPAPPSPGTSMCVWCCNARTRSSSSSPFSIVCLSFLGNDATVTGGGGQGKFQRQIFRYHISLFLDSRDRRRGDPMLRGWVLSRGGGSDVT